MSFEIYVNRGVSGPNMAKITFQYEHLPTHAAPISSTAFNPNSFTCFGQTYGGMSGRGLLS